MRRRRTQSTPIQVAATIEREFDRLGEAPPLPYAVVRAWEETVGAHIARRARPTRLKGTTLIVRAETSSWLAHLQMLTPTIIEGMCRAIAPRQIETLRFELGTLPSVFAERHRPSRPSVEPISPDDLPEGVAEAIRGVENDELRQVIQEVVGQCLAYRLRPTYRSR